MVAGDPEVCSGSVLKPSINLLDVANQGHEQADSLPAASIEVHERLWHAVSDIDGVLVWTQWVSVWLFSLAILGFLSIYFSLARLVGLLDLIFGGILFVITAAGNLVTSRKARRLLDEWDEAMLPFLYSVKFEMLPVTETPRERDIWDRYKSLHRNLRMAEKSDPISRAFRRTAPGKFFITSELKFNSNVKGRKTSPEFNVYAKAEDKVVLFVRRFGGSAPTSRIELEQLESDVQDCLKRRNADEVLVGAFSAAGFSPEAIAFANSDEHLIAEEFDLDLVEEKGNGYRVVPLASI